MSSVPVTGGWRCERCGVVWQGSHQCGMGHSTSNPAGSPKVKDTTPRAAEQEGAED